MLTSELNDSWLLGAIPLPPHGILAEIIFLHWHAVLVHVRSGNSHSMPRERPSISIPEPQQCYTGCAMHTHMTGSKIMKVCVLLSSLQTYSLKLPAVQKHLQNRHLADPLTSGRITGLDKAYWLDIWMPSRCLPWSKSEVVWQPQPNSFDSGLLHLKELDIALAVSSGVTSRCRRVTRACQHQLRQAWKRWNCLCLYKLSLKTSSVEGFDWARFQFKS